MRQMVTSATFARAMTGGVLRRFLRVHHLAKNVPKFSTQGTAGFAREYLICQCVVFLDELKPSLASLAFNRCASNAKSHPTRPLSRVSEKQSLITRCSKARDATFSRSPGVSPQPHPIHTPEPPSTCQAGLLVPSPCADTTAPSRGGHFEGIVNDRLFVEISRPIITRDQRSKKETEPMRTISQRRNASEGYWADREAAMARK